MTAGAARIKAQQQLMKDIEEQANNGFTNLSIGPYHNSIDKKFKFLLETAGYVVALPTTIKRPWYRGGYKYLYGSISW